MTGNDNEVFKYLAWLLSVPIAWVWREIRRMEKESKQRDNYNQETILVLKEDHTSHKLRIAGGYLDKDEVKEFIREAIEPIRKDIGRIDTNTREIFNSIDSIKDTIHK